MDSSADEHGRCRRRLEAVLSPAQTPAERQRTYTERREAQGLKLMRNLWAHPDDHQAVKALAEKLQRKRAKEQSAGKP
jgi:hypothetical protein